MARWIATILLGATLATIACNVPARTEQHSPVVHIAIVMDGPSERAAPLRGLFLEEMRAVNRGEFSLLSPPDLVFEADRTLSGVRTALERALADPRTDLVITLGVLGSHAAAQYERLPKPVLAPFIPDPQLQGLPYKDGTSGRKNLSYVNLDVNIGRDLKAFREIVPFTRLAFLLDGAMVDAIPGIREEVMRVAREHGITVTPVAVADAAAPALAAIPKDTQAVYVGPLLRLSSEEYQRLIAGLIERRLPSFAFSGKSDVELGLLVGIAPALDMERLARRVALNARRILLGEDAATLPVAFARQEGITLNMRTARAIGYSPSWQLLTRAELLYDELEPAGSPLSFAAAVREAVEVNLTIRIAQANVAAGKENIRQARSALLPQIGLTGRHTRIEEDDAAAIPGRAERTSTGSVTLDQSLYSEPAWANLEVQKQLQAARESEREQVRLDIVLETARTYLDVLRAKTNERVQKNNLRLT
ncbi:MAG: TolC family protein, partial [Gammaproteobacteria bacterium]|nr:TolC family protein [Gammaproteobacteria bacterium]